MDLKTILNFIFIALGFLCFIFTMVEVQKLFNELDEHEKDLDRRIKKQKAELKKRKG